MSDIKIIGNGGTAIPIAVVFFDPEAPAAMSMTARLTKPAHELLGDLDPTQLAIFTIEAALQLRKAIEGK